MQRIAEFAKHIFKTLGTGYSESIYHNALKTELRLNQIQYETEVIVPVHYRNHQVGHSRLDLMVYFTNEQIPIELKAVAYKPRASEIAQLRCYLRSLDINQGMLINFPQPSAKKARDEVDIVYVSKNEPSEDELSE